MSTEEAQSFFDEDVDLFAEAAAKRESAGRSQGGGASKPARRKAAAANRSAASAGKKKPARKKAASKKEGGSKKKAGSKKQASPPKPGFLTRGVHAGLRAVDGDGRWGPWAWGAYGAMLVLIISTAIAEHQNPTAPTPEKLDMRVLSGPDVPRSLRAALVNRYPGLDALVHSPDNRTCADYRAWLQERQIIADVDSVAIGYNRDRPVLIVEAHVRQPLLRVVLADGSYRWLGTEGVILPDELAGPDHGRTNDGRWLPRVREVEGADHEVIAELVDTWPAIERCVPPGLITDIYCRAPLGTGERGLVLVTAHGTRIIWGHPGDADVGMDAGHKIASLRRALMGNGDLRAVERINLRFDEPVTTLARR